MSVLPEAGFAMKTASVYVVGINQKIKRKSIKPNKLPIIETQAFSRTSQPSCRCVNARARSLNVRRNTANVSAQV